MMPKLNPKQMQRMMKQMGIEQEELDVRRVEFFFDDHKVIIEPASVAIVKMMGQESFQVTGEIRSEPLDSTPDISDDDIKTVADQAGVSDDEARKAIVDCGGDLAEAIMRLSEKE